MIRLHHLNQSRSLRILWLLEELGEPYEIISYQRDEKTNLAPKSLQQVHPLGKSPVIEIDGNVYAESGAITQILIERFAPDRLRPAVDSEEYGRYLEWINFAESSLMVPILLELFTKKAEVDDNKFLKSYISAEKNNLLVYLDHEIKNKSYLVGNQLSGADFMLAFDLMMLEKNDELKRYPQIKQYLAKLAAHDSYQRALEIEAKYDESE